MAATSVISVLLGRNELAPVCIGLDGWVVAVLLVTIDRDISVGCAGTGGRAHRRDQPTAGKVEA